ncbi:hypothetical protein V8E52_004311 [Russula decolorans]
MPCLLSALSPLHASHFYVLYWMPLVSAPSCQCFFETQSLRPSDMTSSVNMGSVLKSETWCVGRCRCRLFDVACLQGPGVQGVLGSVPASAEKWLG